jgi:hypothetical protein
VPRLLKLCLVIFATISLLLFASQGVGRALPGIPAAIADLDTCVLPCWRGITPRETTMRAAAQALAGYVLTTGVAEDHFNMKFYRAPLGSGECSVVLGNSRGSVAAVSLTHCGENALLGDVMRLLGDPDGMVGWNTLRFRGGQVFVTVAGDVCHERMTPHSRVQGIFIVSHDRTGRGLFVRQFAPETIRLYGWAGFASRAHYYRLAPELQVCR